MSVESFGDMKARWYQVFVHNAVVEALKAGHKRIAVIQPTGTGKTLTGGLIMISQEIRQLLGVKDRPMNVLFVTHRHKLLSQAVKTYGIDESINVIPHMASSPLAEDTKFDLVVIDECHHEATHSMQLQLEQISKAPMIGLTATIERNDKRLCKFSTFIEPLTRDEAVAQGFLAKPEVYTYVDSPSRSHVDVGVEIVQRHHDMMGQTMVFCRTKREVIEMQGMLSDLGLTSRSLIDMSEKELEKQLVAFENGEYQYAISCMKLGEGVDIKGCESVVIARTLQSIGLLNQMIGRASRPDCACKIFETINPLSNDNIDATMIVGQPDVHHFYYKVRGEWREQNLAIAA